MAPPLDANDADYIKGHIGGPGRNRTGIQGFAVLCITTLPPDPTVSRSGAISDAAAAGSSAVPLDTIALYKRPRVHRTGSAMQSLSLDYAAARDHMVDGQLRPNKVTDPRIVRAMGTLPRERFVPPHLATLAYTDEDLPLPGGRSFMEPVVLARLIQLARVRSLERALVVGAGAGYGAAVLAAC